MPTVKQAIARASRGGSAATQYRKSARTSARAFAQTGRLGAAARRRKSLGGMGG